VDLTRHYTHIQLDEFYIMPNHVHGIIIILDRDKSRRGRSHLSAKASLPEEEVSSEGCSPTQETRPYHNRYPLSEYIRAFKSFSARRINVFRKTPGLPVWQYNNYETSIRHESDLNRIVRRHMPLTKDNFSQVSTRWRIGGRG
jgi:hypothetical protein